MALILSIVNGARAQHGAGIRVDACKRESVPAGLSNDGAEIVGQHWDNLIGDCAQVFERANLYTSTVPQGAGLVALVGFILAFTQCPCETADDGKCGYDPSDCNQLGLVGTYLGPPVFLVTFIWVWYCLGGCPCVPPVFLIHEFEDCQRRWDERLQGATFTCRVDGKPKSIYSSRWFEITFDPAPGGGAAATTTPGSLQLAA